MLVQGAGYPDHLETAAHLGRAARKYERRLVAQAELAFGNVQVAYVERDVLWLHIRRLQVDHVEMLRQTGDVAEIRQRAVASPSLDVGDMRRSTDTHERDAVTAYVHVALGRPTLNDKLAGSRCERLFDQSAIQIHHLRCVVDAGARLGESRAGAGIQHPDSQPLQNA